MSRRNIKYTLLLELAEDTKEDLQTSQNDFEEILFRMLENACEDIGLVVKVVDTEILCEENNPGNPAWYWRYLRH